MSQLLSGNTVLQVAPAVHLCKFIGYTFEGLFAHVSTDAYTYILNPFLMSLVFCMCIQHTYVCILIQWKCHLIASNSTAVVVFGPPADQSNLCACALTLLIHPLTAAYNTHKPRNLNAIYRSRSAYCANSHAALTRCCCSHALCCAASTSVCGFNFVHASHPRIASF